MENTLPKFRAYNPDTKDMLYSFEAPTLGAFFMGISLAPDSIIMQSSGIIDKMGAEIYQKDIVKIWLHGWGKEREAYIGTIVFKDGSFFIDNPIDIKYKEPKCDYRPHNSLLISQPELYEVIGKEYIPNYGEVFTFSERAAYIEVIGNACLRPDLLTIQSNTTP